MVCPSTKKAPRRGERRHRIVLDNRNRLTVSGVDGVESFDETSIVMSTAEGSLIIRGESLHIEKLSLDGGDLLVEGTVDSLTYEEEEPRQGSFLAVSSGDERLPSGADLHSLFLSGHGVGRGAAV